MTFSHLHVCCFKWFSSRRVPYYNAVVGSELRVQECLMSEMILLLIKWCATYALALVNAGHYRRWGYGLGHGGNFSHCVGVRVHCFQWNYNFFISFISHNRHLNPDPSQMLFKNKETVILGFGYFSEALKKQWLGHYFDRYTTFYGDS